MVINHAEEIRDFMGDGGYGSKVYVHILIDIGDYSLRG